MTKKDALTIALSTLTAPTYPNPSFDCEDITRKEIPVEEIRETITKMIAQLSKSHTLSDEAKAKRKEKTAQARASLMEQVLPILRDGLSNYPDVGQTAKELFENNSDVLPADFTVAKVRYILLHEMKDEVEKIEAKNKPNVYKLRS